MGILIGLVVLYFLGCWVGGVVEGLKGMNRALDWERDNNKQKRDRLERCRQANR